LGRIHFDEDNTATEIFSGETHPRRIFYSQKEVDRLQAIS
jgi:hypothetical protein